MAQKQEEFAVQNLMPDNRTVAQVALDTVDTRDTCPMVLIVKVDVYKWVVVLILINYEIYLKKLNILNINLNIY